MPILVIEIPSLEQVHSDAKHGVNIEEQNKWEDEVIFMPCSL